MCYTAEGGEEEHNRMHTSEGRSKLVNQYNRVCTIEVGHAAAMGPWEWSLPWLVQYPRVLGSARLPCSGEQHC